MLDLEQLTRPESEAGVIATLIHSPEYAYYSENLKPNHFSRRSNQIIYQTIQNLAEKAS